MILPTYHMINIYICFHLYRDLKVVIIGAITFSGVINAVKMEGSLKQVIVHIIYIV